MDLDILKTLRENTTVPVEVAGRALGLGRNSAYKAARAGEIMAHRLGSKFVCPTAPILRMLAVDGAPPLAPKIAAAPPKAPAKPAKKTRRRRK